MKLNNKELQFFKDQFSIGSGIETCQGTKKLWNKLEKLGYVTKMKYGGFLGHTFSYNITEKGRGILKQTS